MRVAKKMILGLWVFILMPFCFADDFLSSGHVMILVSFSMPENSIKGWMKEAEKIHAPIVIRGLVNNSFKETLKKMAGLTTDNQGGVQLNPMVFQRYQVTKIPAVIVTSAPACLPTQSCEAVYDVVYGNTTLEYALKKVVAQNDALSRFAENALNEMKIHHAI